MGAKLVSIAGRQPNQIADFSTVVALLKREALFQNAVIYWPGFDCMQTGFRRVGGTKPYLYELAADQPLTLLAGDALWEPTEPPPCVGFRLC